MKQILQNLRSGETVIADVPVPAVGPGSVLVRTRSSLISAGTERMLVEFSRGGLIAKARSQPDKVKQVLDKIKTDGLLPTLEVVFNRLDEPLPLGYCNAGEVVEVGRGVTQFKPGDRVISNGPHAEFVVVPTNLCAKIPDGVSFDEAAFTVLCSIGLQGIRLAAPTLGERIVVFGLGLIGLVTVQMLRANGCQVLGIDVNQDRLQRAEELGATVCNAREGNPISAASAWTEGAGVDAVIVTASAKSDDIMHQAAEMSRKRGRVVLVGVVGLNLRRSDFFEKELTFQVSCSYGPGRYDEDYEQRGRDYPRGFVRWTEQRNFEAVLDLLSSKTLRVGDLITDRVALADASNAYDNITSNGDSLGIVLEYSADACARRTLRVTEASAPPHRHCVAAMIGAGNFAKMVMAPALTKTQARLKYVSELTNAAAATHVARKFGFEYATTDSEAIWDDKEVNTVFIATGHGSHAQLVCQGLRCGKHVFVEKPLAMNVKEVADILQTKRECPDSQVMVGFNRRFSPHIQKVRQLLAGRAEPLAMHFSCNAGIIPPDVWVHDPERGGGRIIGEACHFIDLLSYIAGSPIVTVAAAQMGEGVAVKEDKMSIVLSFEDGSVGTVNYFGNGHKAYPKESLEVFSEGRVLRLDNFRRLDGFGFQNFKRMKTRLNKGHESEFAAFVDRVVEGGYPLIPVEQLVNVTLASFAAVTSAAERRAIDLEQEYGEVFGKNEIATRTLEEPVGV